MIPYNEISERINEFMYDANINSDSISSNDAHDIILEVIGYLKKIYNFDIIISDISQINPFGKNENYHSGSFDVLPESYWKLIQFCCDDSSDILKNKLLEVEDILIDQFGITFDTGYELLSGNREWMIDWSLRTNQN